MPRINGGVVGKSNRPAFFQAGGAWQSGDIENARRTGTWPLALSTTALAVTHSSAPHVSAYPWSSSGFGTKYANPTTLIPNAGSGVNFSPSGDSIAVAHIAAPNVSVYPWSSTGFGTKYADPSTLPASSSNGVHFSPNGNNIAVAHANAPHVSAYPWSSSGFGTKYADPSTSITGTGNWVNFGPDNSYIMVSTSSVPYINAYSWSSSGFGARYNNPAQVLQGNAGRKFGINPVNNDIVTTAASGSVSAYPFSTLSGFGTRYALVSGLTGSGSSTLSAAFTSDGTEVAIGGSLSPRIHVFQWQQGAGFGTKYSDPASLPPSDPNGVAFNPAGNSLAVAHANTPFITVYPWAAGAGFGTRYANPTTLPSSTGSSVAFTTISI